MKIACPTCKRYYSLDQCKTGIIETKGTILTCELCGGHSMVVLHKIESVSMAKRIVTQAESAEGGEA